MKQSPSLEASSRLSSYAFYGTWSFITVVFEPASGPCPVPDEPSPHPHIMFL
jgi:hypothetical protein